MSFRFNFPCSFDSGNADNEISASDPNECSSDCSYTVDERNLKSCEFLSINNEKLKIDNEDISLLQIGDLEIKYTLIDSVQVKTKDETFSQISTLQTDIIPGKYEGGLKIWECSVDLANYITENNCINDEDDVLELGCGAGLPGLVAYIKGAIVTFQDFNPEVLEYSTLPNTMLNTTQEKLCKIPEMCQYLFGDWETIHKKYYSNSCTGKKYDTILTSETIYDKSNQKKLLKLMKAALKPKGKIYLAAKIHYFGVGGGIVDFETLINTDKSFEIVSVHRIMEGVERQILTLKFR